MQSAQAILANSVREPKRLHLLLLAPTADKLTLHQRLQTLPKKTAISMHFQKLPCRFWFCFLKADVQSWLDCCALTLVMRGRARNYIACQLEGTSLILKATSDATRARIKKRLVFQIIFKTYFDFLCNHFVDSFCNCQSLKPSVATAQRNLQFSRFF